MYECCDKRDLCIWQHKGTYLTDEICSHVWRPSLKILRWKSLTDMTKETHIFDKRNLRTLVATLSDTTDVWMLRQNRHIYMIKEILDKRNLHTLVATLSDTTDVGMLRQKRHIYMTKEIYIFDAQNLRTLVATLIHTTDVWMLPQKRHIYVTKEVHIWRTKLAYSCGESQWNHRCK